MRNTPLPPQYVWIIAPLGFVGMWLLITFIMSRCGWRSFSSRHPVYSQPSGNSYNCHFATFGKWMRYKNAVRVVFTGDAIYFYMMFMFRLFHPPFLVPWSSVKRVEKKDGLFGSHYYWLEIQDDAGRIQVRLPARVEQDLAQYRKLD